VLKDVEAQQDIVNLRFQLLSRNVATMESEGLIAYPSAFSAVDGVWSHIIPHPYGAGKCATD
jgi:hypothetical protein